ncbi:MAG: pseudouridine synthase [bacterium]
MERLQKILAQAGVGSRRRCKELILEGHISVNGKIVKIPGVKIDTKVDTIRFDGSPIKLERKVYLLLNKPKGYVTTLSDPEGRPTISSLLKGVKERVYPVGRLDYNSEGLLFLTNDGDLTNKLIHPKYKVPKTYLVKFKGKLEEKDIMRLRRGIRLNEGKTLPAKVVVEKILPKNTILKITITEGKKRQIRRMGEIINHTVLSLKRTQFGPFRLGKLKKGEYVYLNSDEVKMKLKNMFSYG